MTINSYDFLGEASVQLFVGIGLALLNVIILYFAPVVPRVISVLRWKNLKRALILAYLIALVLQLVTSPFFVSAFHPVSVELAWSPYQALFNVLGVILIDLIVMGWKRARRGAELGRKQIDVVKARAAEGLDEVSARLALTPEGRDEHAARQAVQQASEAQAAADRKQRIDERLKDF